MFQSFLPSNDAGAFRRGGPLPVMECTPGAPGAPSWDARLPHDLKTLARFIECYCRCRHHSAEKSPATVPGFDVNAIARKEVVLCHDCARLLTHAFVKRSRCPFSPKPRCKHCPRHCYHPTYRRQIRQVMRFSGKRLLLTGRWEYLYHLLF